MILGKESMNVKMENERRRRKVRLDSRVGLN